MFPLLVGEGQGEVSAYAENIINNIPIRPFSVSSLRGKSTF